MTAPKSKVEDGNFLADEFGIAPERAAELVSTDEKQAAEVKRGIERHNRSRDALEGVPTPQTSDDFTADTDETRLKPVLRTPNDRAGAG